MLFVVFWEAEFLHPDAHCTLSFAVIFTAEIISRILEQTTNNNIKNKYLVVVESGVCGGVAEFDVAGIGVLST